VVGWDGGKVKELDFCIFIKIFFCEAGEGTGKLGSRRGGNGKKIERETKGKRTFSRTIGGGAAISMDAETTGILK
jgi:hypothetical protein